MSPEKEPFQEEISSSNHHFSGDLLVLGVPSLLRSETSAWHLPFFLIIMSQTIMHPVFHPGFHGSCYYSKCRSYRSMEKKDKAPFIFCWLYVNLWMGWFFFGTTKKTNLCSKSIRAFSGCHGSGGQFLLVGWGYLDLEDGKAWVKPITGGFVGAENKSDFKPCGDWWERFTFREEAIWWWWR